MDIVRQLRFGAALQAAAAVMFAISFVARLIGSGLDLLTAAMLVAAVGTGAAAVVLRRKAAQLQSEG